MVDPGVEIKMRESVMECIAHDDVWQEWTALAYEAAKLRISWPDTPVHELPAATMWIGNSSAVRGATQGSLIDHWVPTGSLTVVFWDVVQTQAILAAIINQDDYALRAANMVEDTRFGTWISGLKESITRGDYYQNQARTKFSAVRLGNPPWVRSGVGSRENQEEGLGEALTGELWRAEMVFEWGAFL